MPAPHRLRRPGPSSAVLGLDRVAFTATSALRMAFAVGVPFALAAATGRTGSFALVLLGAYQAELSDPGGYVPARLRLLLPLGLAMLVGYTAGALAAPVAGHGWAVVGVCALLAAIGSCYVRTATAALGGLNFTANGLVALAAPDGLDRLPLSLGLLTAGWLWGTALALPCPARSRRQAVRGVWRSVARLLDSVGTGRFANRSHWTGAGLQGAREAAERLRTARPGVVRAEGGWLARLTDLAGMVRFSAMDLHERRAGVPPGASGTARTVAGTLSRTRSYGPAHPAAAGKTLEERLDTALRTALDGPPRDTAPAPPRPRTPLWRLALPMGADAAYTFRVTALIAAATAAGLLLRSAEWYWAPFSAYLIVRPDPLAIRLRAVQRALGTLAGATLLAALFTLHPGPWGTAAIATAAAVLVPVGLGRNYAVMVAGLTPFMLVVVSGLTHDSYDLPLARLVDVSAGCAVVLLLGAVLWPVNGAERVARSTAETIRAAADHLRTLTEWPTGAAEPTPQSVRLADRRLRLLDDTVRQTGLLCPFRRHRPRHPDPTTLIPALHHLFQRTADLGHSTLTAPLADAERVTAESLAGHLNSLADAVERNRTDPPPPPEPGSSPQLRPVEAAVAELYGTWTAVGSSSHAGQACSHFGGAGPAG
ncbi:FUSC family protein [Streptomyces sp. AV19]|uniref:FUSC family protein n=1 Tax=Streptomyces sp. AV19 TaxID=2793068 RepID=UPI0018FEB253|nr:FUSC family protein [Streptomyces sp. AV19]MBH1937681.1 FUSC family protein [Streptomyces sp. AV19]MDG4536348.1 FUSC family protein [Streptomyces sp. AV19]